jgi:hypothetical protein
MRASSLAQRDLGSRRARRVLAPSRSGRRRALQALLVAALLQAALPTAGIAAYRSEPASFPSAADTQLAGHTRHLRLLLAPPAEGATGERLVALTCRTSPFGSHGTASRIGSGGVLFVAPAGQTAIGSPAPAAEASRPEDENPPRGPDLEPAERPPGVSNLA